MVREVVNLRVLANTCLPSCLRRGGSGFGSPSGAFANHAYTILQIQESRVSPPVLGGVAAASADGVVIFA